VEAGTTAWVAQVCASGAATVVATADDEGRAAITRGWGIAMSPERRVTLCVSASAGSPTRSNLTANGRIAVTVVDPTTYAAVQSKGVADIVRDPTDRELEDVATHVRRFSDAVATIGLLDVECMMLGDLVMVEFTAWEIADQTPGGDAGRVLA
jgi:flavin reductase (DIM6/NTAB) family NADH-FMN oxidoreductase RutF